MNALRLKWDRLIMLLTDEDELCVWSRGRTTAFECIRRYGHRGRHIWRFTDCPYNKEAA